MRVIFLINSFSLCGAEKLVMDLSSNIVSKCDFVGIIALYHMGDTTEKRLISELNKQNIYTYILDKRAKKDRFSTVCKAARIVRKEKPDVVHAHCSVPLMVAKFTGLLTNTPVIGTIHNTRGYSTRRERLTGWMCKCYVSICAAVEQYMVNGLKILPQKIVRIYNAVETERFTSADKIENFWKRYGLSEELPVILNIGRVVEQKNQLCLLRALDYCQKQGHPFQCAILGNYDVTSCTYKELQNFLTKSGLHDRVKFLGQQENVPMFLTNADIFAMTSFYEGFSVSFIEALLCQTPIVVTDMPFVRELEQVGLCATVIPQNDYLSLSEVLLSGDIHHLDKSILKNLRSKFSMERFAREHLELYASIIDNGKER